MGWFSRMLGGKPTPAPGEEQAVILHLRLGDDRFGSEQERADMRALQGELARAVARAGAGELDGDEFGEGYCKVFLYGPSAEALWEAIAPALEERPFRRGSHAVKRSGGPDSGRQERIDLHWDG